ncbi:SCO family protein [Campylobacter jejuni]|nr:SCO family protein [Campylobacter jejuni]MBC5860810.1 SCO family protein [Campylobacter jejuni]
MKKNIILFIVIVAIILGVIFFLKNHQNSYDFILKSYLKEETTLKDFKGDKLIIYFGYTYCPDICPVTLSLVGKALKQINNPQAHLLFISLDLDRDNNLSNTNEWLRYFYPKADALIAKDEKTLQKIVKQYNVQYQKIDLNDSFMGYSIAHSNMLYLIDEKGHFYKEISDLNPQEILRELRNFLNSQ